MQSFVAWKKKKIRDKKEKEEAEVKAKKEKIRMGKAVGSFFRLFYTISFQLGMTGRDLFMFNADMIADDDEADDVAYAKEENADVKVASNFT